MSVCLSISNFTKSLGISLVCGAEPFKVCYCLFLFFHDRLFSLRTVGSCIMIDCSESNGWRGCCRRLLSFVVNVSGVSLVLTEHHCHLSVAVPLFQLMWKFYITYTTRPRGSPVSSVAFCVSFIFVVSGTFFAWEFHFHIIKSFKSMEEQRKLYACLLFLF